jgi:hypothetical protein
MISLTNRSLLPNPLSLTLGQWEESSGLGGTNINERQNLEKFMQNISPKSLTYVDWYRRNPVYP